jgi:hypothetical protein
MTSAITAVANENGKSLSFYIYIDVYGLYDQLYRTVSSHVKKSLQTLPQSASPERLQEELRKFLQVAPKQLGYAEDAVKPQELEEAIAEFEMQAQLDEQETGKKRLFSAEVYEEIAIKLLIVHEKKKDVEGVKLVAFCDLLRDCYCKPIDAQPALKKKILSEMGLPVTMADLNQSIAKYIDPIITQSRYPATHETKAKQIDYSKSESIKIKVWESTPQTRPLDKIIISEAGQVLWTKIYDWVTNPLTREAIKTVQEFENFCYSRGDNKRDGGKPFFKLMQQIDIITPGVYWGQKQRGSFQLKASVQKVTQKIVLQGGSRSLGDDEYQRDMQEARDAIDYYKAVLGSGAETQPPSMEWGDGNSGGGTKRAAPWKPSDEPPNKKAHLELNTEKGRYEQYDDEGNLTHVCVEGEMVPIEEYQGEL